MLEVSPEFEIGAGIDFPPLRLVNGGLDFDAMEDWECHEYVADMFEEASKIPFDGKHLVGPYYAETRHVLEQTSQTLKAINLGLTPEHLMPKTYQSFKAASDIAQLPLTANDVVMLSSLRRERLLTLMTLGLERAAAAREIIIPEGVLDEPPYYRQENSGMACFRACFRMVFDGATGSAPEESTISKALIDVHRESLVHDEEFLKVFSTPTFKRLYPEVDVRVITITGADLETIHTLATRLKQKQPDVKMFCIVNLQTETSSVGDVWHTNVLLRVTPDHVITRDPSDRSGVGAPMKAQSKEKFHRRWAIAFNRAHLIIAA